MADETSCQDQLVSQSCQCRAGVAQLIPGVRAALQERLDEMFQATSYFIRRCEGIAFCGTRRVNCTDLSCVMAVVQEADGCSEHMSKDEIDGTINASFGLYAVDIN